MEIRSQEDVKQNIVDFANRFLSLQLQKKAIDEEIADLKAEFKENGVPVGIVTKCINSIKSKKKKTESEIFELETIEAWLESDKGVDQNITELVAK